MSSTESLELLLPLVCLVLYRALRLDFFHKHPSAASIPKTGPEVARGFELVLQDCHTLQTATSPLGCTFVRRS